MEGQKVKEEKQRTPEEETEEEKEHETTCPECGGDIITEEGEQLCSECGLVVNGQQIDRGPE